MKTITESPKRKPWKFTRMGVLTFAASMALAENTFAQGVGNSPWENAVQVLQTSFTGPIATGLALVAIVVGGLVFAFGEGGAKRTMAGIIFGVGMAIGAVNFMTWLFPASGHANETNQSGVPLAQPPAHHSGRRAEALFLCPADGRRCLQPDEDVVGRDSDVLPALLHWPVGDKN